MLSQVPYVLSFATPRRSRRLTLGDTLVEFHQLKGTLFFGYTLVEGLNIADPEKALLDQLYLIARGCPKDRFRANMVAFVFLATLGSIVVMAAGGAVSPSTMALAWKLTPGVLLGFVAGSYLRGRLAPQAFDTVVLAYLALVGVLGMASVIL